MIIADNASSTEEPSNPCFSVFVTSGSPCSSTSVMPGSFRSSTLVIFGSFCFSTPVKFSDYSNSMTNFLIDILANLFGDFGVDASSNLIQDLMPFPAIFSLFDLPILGWLLWDDFSTLATDAFFALSWDVFPNYSPSAGYSLPPPFLSPGNSTTSEYFNYLFNASHPLSPPLLPSGNFTTSSHPSSSSYSLLLFFPPFGNSTLDHLPSLDLFPPLPSFANSIYD